PKRRTSSSSSPTIGLKGINSCGVVPQISRKTRAEREETDHRESRIWDGLRGINYTKLHSENRTSRNQGEISRRTAGETGWAIEIAEAAAGVDSDWPPSRISQGSMLTGGALVGQLPRTWP